MTNRIVEILREQVSEQLSDDDVEIVPDGQISKLFAVRVGKWQEYLVNVGTKAVEKVEFDRWPPQ